jgi:hypothetical protein
MCICYLQSTLEYLPTGVKCEADDLPSHFEALQGGDLGKN